MKKLLNMLFIFSLFAIFNVSIVFAVPSDRQDDNFTITSGVDLSKDIKYTFDKTRNIVGKADEGSIITITLSEKKLEKEEKLEEKEKYKIVVGASGYFAQTVNLTVGTNIIDISMQNGEKTENVTAYVKRKKSEIKKELEQSVILPRYRK